MPGAATDNPADAALHAVMAADRGRILAALIASTGDFVLAEDALQDALTSALEHWRRSDVPRNPAGWLVQVARRKAIDRLRRARTFASHSPELARMIAQDQQDAASDRAQEIPDHRLRLIFTCCHPALDPKTRIALTLRTLGGLTTDEIARAFLDRTPAMAQRLSRARQKIARSGVPFKIPEAPDLPDRVQAVCQVIYLIFNEGYAATEGQRQLRVDLCEEALFLARLMRDLMPGDAEVEGLLALLCLTHARRAARTGAGDVYVPLSEHDRRMWDRDLIGEGTALAEQALSRGRVGPYQLQAAISALHCEAADHRHTDWPQIAALYRVLLQMDQSEVVRLNAAVALSFAGQTRQALKDLEALVGDLASYQPYHAARADLLLRAGRAAEAVDAYTAALDLTRIDSERRFLERRRQAARDDQNR